MKKRRNYWNDKSNIFAEARKYKTKSEFQKNNRTAYMAALKMGCIEEMDWFENGKTKPHKWDKETTFAESKKYNTKKDFRIGCRGGYASALKKGWFSEMYWLNELCKPNGYWNNKENLFAEARKYRTKTEFARGNHNAYSAARKNGLLDEMDWFESGFNVIEDPIYTVYCYRFKELNTIYIGLTMRLTNRDLQHHTNKKSTVYKFAQMNNVEIPDMEVLCDNIKQTEAQEYERKLVAVSKYCGLKVLNKGKVGIGKSSLGGAVKKWAKTAIKKEAAKYNKRTEFARGSGSAYRAALRFKMMDTLFPV